MEKRSQARTVAVAPVAYSADPCVAGHGRCRNRQGQLRENYFPLRGIAEFRVAAGVVSYQHEIEGSGVAPRREVPMIVPLDHEGLGRVHVSRQGTRQTLSTPAAPARRLFTVAPKVGDRAGEKTPRENEPHLQAADGRGGAHQVQVETGSGGHPRGGPGLRLREEHAGRARARGRRSNLDRCEASLALQPDIGIVGAGITDIAYSVVIPVVLFRVGNTRTHVTDIARPVTVTIGLVGIGCLGAKVRRVLDAIGVFVARRRQLTVVALPPTVDGAVAPHTAGESIGGGGEISAGLDVVELADRCGLSRAIISPALHAGIRAESAAVTGTGRQLHEDPGGGRRLPIGVVSPAMRRTVRA